MRIFDDLPRGLQTFLATYPRGVKAWDAAHLLDYHNGDVDAVIAEIKRLLPVRRGP